MSKAEPQLANEEAAPKGKSLLGKLKVVGIVVTVVIVQCVVISIFLPFGEDHAAHASSKPEPTSHQAAEHHEADGGEQTEVDLGAFSLTVFNPNTNNNLLIDFHLYGTVSGSPAVEAATDGGHGGGHGGHAEPAAPATGDAAKLETLLKKNKHRFRDQIIITVRNAQISDLADPGLGLIKRQILTKTNALLGEPLLKEVVFSDFVVVEQ